MKNETPFLGEITAVDRPLYEAVKALDESTLNEQLKPWLFEKGSVKDLLECRDRIVEKLDKLAQERGDAAAFPP